MSQHDNIPPTLEKILAIRSTRALLFPLAFTWLILIKLDMHLGNRDVVIQIDGCWDRTTRRGGAAWMMCHEPPNHNERQWISFFFFASSALLTEAKACHQALLWARSALIGRDEIITSSLLLVQDLASPYVLDISISHIIQEIRLIAGSSEYCTIHKVSRERVAQAHQLAKEWCLMSI